MLPGDRRWEGPFLLQRRSFSICRPPKSRLFARPATRNNRCAFGSLQRGSGERVQPLNPDHGTPLTGRNHRHTAACRGECQGLPDEHTFEPGAFGRPKSKSDGSRGSRYACAAPSPSREPGEGRARNRTSNPGKECATRNGPGRGGIARRDPLQFSFQVTCGLPAVLPVFSQAAEQHVIQRRRSDTGH